MHQLLQWYKFLRMTNILIMVITFYLIRLLVLIPYANAFEVALIFNDWNFTLLIIVTMLSASAGNIVNDIYDVKIDEINKPEKVFVHRIISAQNAWRLYLGLNVVALILIFCVYSSIDWFLIWMYPFGFFLTWGMLWLYSYRYKKSVLIGNIIVGIFVSFVPWSVCYPELVNALIGKIPYHPLFVATGIIYILFAFISTILREIIKDIEDKEGDAQFGGRTLPIAYGVPTAKRIAQLIGAILLLMMSVSVYFLSIATLPISAVYGICTVILPTIYLLVSLEKAVEKQTFHQLSQIAKLVMLAGLVFLIVLYFEYWQGL
jgi:4-hydroxybenzoate polyprenyltransferase